jgi:ABC-type proline/glycine betaine transport system substrate-binding protein
MLYNLDTKEEVDFDKFFNAVENGEIIIDGRNWTEKDSEDVRKAIAEHKAERQKKQAEEHIPA